MNVLVDQVSMDYKKATTLHEMNRAREDVRDWCNIGSQQIKELPSNTGFIGEVEGGG